MTILKKQFLNLINLIKILNYFIRINLRFNLNFIDFFKIEFL